MFSTLNEQDQYWLGYFIADGWARHQGNSKKISIYLESIDKEHIEKFKKYLGTSNAIYQYSHAKGQDSYRVQFTNQEVTEVLYSLGMIKDNKKNPTVPTCLEDSKHFWRGVMDGDGSFGLYKHVDGKSSWVGKKVTASLVGSFDVCKSFQRFCVKNGIQLVDPVFLKKTTIYRAGASGNKKAPSF